MARILVVDDDLSNVEVIQLVLQSQRHKVRSINHSAQIDFTVASFKPELIVTDILLDDGDGRKFVIF